MILSPCKHWRKIIFFVNHPVKAHKINKKSLLASHNIWFHVERGVGADAELTQLPKFTGPV